MEARGLKEMLMRIAIIVSMLLVAPAIAQEQRQEPPDVKLLTPDECSQITKRPQGDFFVKGSIEIGGMTIKDGNVPPHGISNGGIDPFNVIQRSCFNGQPTGSSPSPRGLL